MKKFEDNLKKDKGREGRGGEMKRWIYEMLELANRGVERLPANYRRSKLRNPREKTFFESWMNPDQLSSNMRIQD